jgi:hypothetical protein
MTGPTKAKNHSLFWLKSPSGDAVTTHRTIQYRFAIVPGWQSYARRLPNMYASPQYSVFFFRPPQAGGQCPLSPLLQLCKSAEGPLQLLGNMVGWREAWSRVLSGLGNWNWLGLREAQIGRVCGLLWKGPPVGLGWLLGAGTWQSYPLGLQRGWVPPPPGIKCRSTIEIS